MNINAGTETILSDEIIALYMALTDSDKVIAHWYLKQLIEEE